MANFNFFKFGSPPKFMLDLGKEVRFRKNEVILKPGQIVDGFYYVKKGRVVGVDYSDSGMEKVSFVMEEQSIFVESHALFDIPLFLFFIAKEDCELLFINKCQLLKLIKEDFEVSMYIMKALTDKFYTTYESLKNTIFHSAEWKICNLLFNLAQNFGKLEPNGMKICLKLSHQFISDILGINRITTVRIISKLKSEKYLQSKCGYYLITDLELFKNYYHSLE